MNNPPPTAEVMAMNEIAFKGNIIPHSWYKHLRYESGKAHLNAIIILSEIVYWYRPSEIRDEETGQLLGYKKRFRADKLQRSTKSFSDQFGLTKKQARDALEFLKSKDLITKSLRTVTTSESILSNVLFIGIKPANIKAISMEVVPPMTSRSHPVDMEVTPSIPGSHTYTETTTETTTETLKASSANADYSLPVSLLTIEEIKALKLYAPDWQKHLDDENAERQRTGVIDFIEKKLAKRLLMPDTPASLLLFKKIAIENDAKGRRSPETFPTLAIKEKFDQAAVRLNGTLEKAIQTGIENVGIAIPKLVNYVASPKWQKGEKSGQQAKGSARTGQPKSYGNQGSSQKTNFAPPAGSGQSAETAARLRAVFAPKL